MPGQYRKLLRRGITVLQNSMNSLLAPLFTIVVSALVVRLASDTLWGAFVGVLVVVQLTAQVVAWGNKEYLLRAFSQHPNQISQAWSRSLSTRLILLFMLAVLLVLAVQSPLLVLLWFVGIVLAQSFDVLVLYRKDFVYSIGVEVLTVVILVGVVLSGGADLTLAQLLTVYALTAWLKVALMAWRYRKTLQTFRFEPELSHLRLALPFFLLTFSGMLASRIDLFTVSVILSERETGQYQVFINLMLYLQAISNFILLPYAKSVYRLRDDAIPKIALRLFVLGSLITLPALVAAQWLLAALYDLHFSAGFMLLGGAFVLPIYGFIPFVYYFYKHDRQQIVLKLNIVGASANLLLNLALLPVLGITGAILASAVMQWGLLILYLYEARELFNGRTKSRVSGDTVSEVPASQ